MSKQEWLKVYEFEDPAAGPTKLVLARGSWLSTKPEAQGIYEVAWVRWSGANVVCQTWKLEEAEEKFKWYLVDARRAKSLAAAEKFVCAMLEYLDITQMPLIFSGFEDEDVATEIVEEACETFDQLVDAVQELNPKLRQQAETAEGDG